MGKPKHKWQQARQLSLVLASQRHAPESEHKPWNRIAEYCRYGRHKNTIKNIVIFWPDNAAAFDLFQSFQSGRFSEIQALAAAGGVGIAINLKSRVSKVSCWDLLGLSQLRLCKITVHWCDENRVTAAFLSLIKHMWWICPLCTNLSSWHCKLELDTIQEHTDCNRCLSSWHGPRGHWIHSGDVLRSRNANLSVVPAHSVSQRQPLIWWVTGWVVHTCQIQVIPISKTRTRCYSKSLATSNMSNMSNMSNIYKMEPMAPMESAHSHEIEVIWGAYPVAAAVVVWMTIDGTS